MIHREPLRNDIDRYRAEAEAMRAAYVRDGFVAFGNWLNALPGRVAGLFGARAHG